MSQPQTKLNECDQAEMVWVPPGPFVMGGDAPNAEPQRSVHLDGYWIYKYPVTVAQYALFCKESARRMPERPKWGWRADHPIVNVSWHDASTYCQWAGVALPTEAEWEKAARGTDGRKFPWGNDWDPDKCQCSRKSYGDARSTSPVTGHPSGVSPYGAFDMAGNVWEWCDDWYKKGKEEYLVVRGGGWYNALGDDFRCACRGRLGPGDRYINSGFRGVSRSGSSPLTLRGEATVGIF